MRFLRLGDGKKSLSKLFFAVKYTNRYLKERKQLKKLYKLRLRDLPSLLKLQRKIDKEEAESLQKAIIAQHIKEKQELITNTIENSRLALIRKFIESELAKHKELGTKTYILSTSAFITDFIKSRLTLDSASKSLVKYANLYHKSLEELVEGHREVTRNHETVLKDGETVSQKLAKFEEKLSEKEVKYKIPSEYFTNNNNK
jgi:hypothetical protein